MSKIVIGATVAVVSVGVVVTAIVWQAPAPVSSMPPQLEKSEVTVENTTKDTSKPADQAVETKVVGTTLEGTFRCWKFNVNGRVSTASCRLGAPIVLNADGTYSFSSEHGTYTVDGDQITLSESKIRGVGTLKEANIQIYFKYTDKGNQYEMTYLKQT